MVSFQENKGKKTKKSFFLRWQSNNFLLLSLISVIGIFG